MQGMQGAVFLRKGIKRDNFQTTDFSQALNIHSHLKRDIR